MRLPIDVSVVVPCYNSKPQLIDLVDDILSWGSTSDGVGNFEVVLVADGPETSKILGKILPSRDDRVIIHSLKRNVGEQAALIAGIEKSRFEYVCTLDDDGQQPPTEVEKLIAELHRGRFDLVYGSPANRSQPLLKYFLSIAVKRLLSVFLAPGAHHVASLRLFKKAVFWDAVSRVKDPGVVLDGVLVQSSAKISSVQVKYRLREQGGSGYTFAGLANHAVGLVMSAAHRPLRSLLWLGLVLSILGALALLAVATDAVFFSNALPPWGLAAAAVILTLGVQFIGVGVVGELVSRMAAELRAKALFEVDEDSSS